ncbi:xanthine phosphoribosyltransferase [Martiniozyma asiatica (nom. inval.)]|nr:xanthine phosphoribosyltransferase [Martiniozyma asiatica]
MSDKLYISYNCIHKLCQSSAEEILKTVGKPDVIIAIGGGGFIPSRIIRSFLKIEGSKNIPIQAIGLSLYEDMGTGEDSIGKEVVRTQWLDFGALEQHFDSLIGKNVLIVDEVDDTRTTLHYALRELYADVYEKAQNLNRLDQMKQTKFSIFVVHNKLKEKRAQLDESLMNGGIYISGEDVQDRWIAYPWESDDIDTHTEKAIAQGNN